MSSTEERVRKLTSEIHKAKLNAVYRDDLLEEKGLLDYVHSLEEELERLKDKLFERYKL